MLAGADTRTIQDLQAELQIMRNQQRIERNQIDLLVTRLIAAEQQLDPKQERDTSEAVIQAYRADQNYKIVQQQDAEIAALKEKLGEITMDGALLLRLRVFREADNEWSVSFPDIAPDDYWRGSSVQQALLRAVNPKYVAGDSRPLLTDTIEGMYEEG